MIKLSAYGASVGRDGIKFLNRSVNGLNAPDAEDGTQRVALHAFACRAGIHTRRHLHAPFRMAAGENYFVSLLECGRSRVHQLPAYRPFLWDAHRLAKQA
ncbi:hypothetical protein Ssi02_54980 [Sinosporangium siamense]|uniref:Uncharacterized protein n=1 Tax=Sinosporangium siamense TaxID=1367973 RepID=A0A919VAC4_9ACTN|nr:hypothetical protein Ssi02_54980 [Sinosporangium siamense]